MKSSTRRIRHLEERQAGLTQRDGIIVDSELNCHLTSIMNDETESVKKAYPDDSFRRILWEQQLQAIRKKNVKNVRRHPAIIRWCLHLKICHMFI